MKRVTLKEVESFGIELNHQVGLDQKEHDELLNDVDYLILSSSDGIAALLFNDGRGHLLPACFSNQPGGLLLKQDPNALKVRKLYLSKGGEKRLGREKLSPEEFRMRMEYLTSLLKELSSRGLDRVVRAVSEDFLDTLIGQGVLEMSLPIPVSTDARLKN